MIAPEQMGHGRTADLVDRPFHYHDMAEDTVELMRQLEIESARVIGYSDGGDHRPRHGDPPPRARDQAGVTGANSRVDGYTAENQEDYALRSEASPFRTSTRNSRPTAQTTGLSFSRS